MDINAHRVPWAHSMLTVNQNTETTELQRLSFMTQFSKTMHTVIVCYLLNNSQKCERSLFHVVFIIAQTGGSLSPRPASNFVCKWRECPKTKIMDKYGL